MACPWCYIGKRRVEAALARFAQRDRVAIVWRSYQLDPSAPRTAEQTVTAVLAQRYGMSLAQASAANERVSALAAAEGLEYHLERARYGSTFDAHRLIHLAATYDLQDAMEERLFRAYFTEGAALGEIATLVTLAAEVGIDRDEARTAPDSDAFADAVMADIARARSLNIQGVPFFSH